MIVIMIFLNFIPYLNIICLSIPVAFQYPDFVALFDLFPFGYFTSLVLKKYFSCSISPEFTDHKNLGEFGQFDWSNTLINKQSVTQRKWRPTWQIPRIRFVNFNLRDDGCWQRKREDLTLQVLYHKFFIGRTKSKSRW